MIHVPRDPKTPDLPVFTEKSSWSLDRKRRLTRAERDLERAIAYYGDPQKPAGGSKPKFEAYSDKALKAELFELFNDKCAYCEMPLAIGANPDVEHFRPKASIDTGKGQLQPGYYWLATEWNNLLLSCQFCNRQQWHLTQGEARLKLGKLDQFPLADEDQRVRSPEEPIEREEPVRLLVQPCIDTDAEEHFRFDREGRIYGETAKGRKSIMVYALIRKGLVDARQEQVLQLTRQFTRVRDAAKNLWRALRRDDDPEEVDDLHRQLDDTLADLERFFDVRSPYLAMKRQFIRSAVRNGELDDLQRIGMEPFDLLKLAR